MEYTQNSIEALELPLRVRPASQLGSNGMEGALHTFREIFANALDEASYGCDTIRVEYKADGSISVADNGRGIPLGWNATEKQWNWYLIFMHMYAGGKYKEKENQKKLAEYKGDWSKIDQSQFLYLFPIGLNGVGAFATQQTSEWLTVVSVRDGVKSTMQFRDGINAWDELQTEEVPGEENGTYIAWKPDDRVFKSTAIPERLIRSICEVSSYVSEVNIYFTDQSGKEYFYPAKTLRGYFDEDGTFSRELTGYYHEEPTPGEIELNYTDIVIGSNSEGKGFQYFHNKFEVHGGAHEDAIRTSIIDFFQSKLKGYKLRYDDITNYIGGIVSAQSNVISPKNQTKDLIEDFFVFNGVKEVCDKLLREAWLRHDEWLHGAVESVKDILDKRSQLEELAQVSRVVKQVTSNKKSPEKFVSCTTYERKQYKETELWLLEGDSAAGAFLSARDSRYQCYFPLRGKLLNMYKASITQLLENQEVQSIVSILGCGVDLGIDEIESFDLSKLKVGKIIFGADADVDGSHINMLGFILVWRLFPKLIEEGMVYVALTPLYDVELQNGKHEYLYTEEEYHKLLAGGTVAKHVTRYKGLGKVNADVLRETTVDPRSRRLVQLKADMLDEYVSETLNTFFSDKVEDRRRLILEGILGKNEAQDLYEYLAELDSIAKEASLDIDNDLEVIDHVF